MIKDITNEDLAKMIKKGFDETASKAELGKLETKVDKGFDKLGVRMGRIETKVVSGK